MFLKNGHSQTTNITFQDNFRNYPISFAKTQENISQILLKSEQPKRKVAATLLCWKCKAENMENCYEKGEIEICDGRLVRLDDNLLEGVTFFNFNSPLLLGITVAIYNFRNHVALKNEDGKGSLLVSN